MSINRETADLALVEASDKSRPSQDAHLLPVDGAFEAFDSSKDGLSWDEVPADMRADESLVQFVTCTFIWPWSEAKAKGRLAVAGRIGRGN